jgi:hypothetical protein
MCTDGSFELFKLLVSAGADDSRTEDGEKHARENDPEMIRTITE